MKDLVLGCWDFAGQVLCFTAPGALTFTTQELYYSTHAFFLSKRSVFLVVFSLAEDIEKSKKRVRHMFPPPFPSLQRFLIPIYYFFYRLTIG